MRVFWREPSSLQMRDFIAVPQRAVEHAADRQPAEIVAVIEIRDQELQASRLDRPVGAGMCFRIASKSGRRLSLSSSGVSLGDARLARWCR